ncbi:MAG TPA: TetR family transcriptional regulator [Kofleriaceae bacterium]|nr:TetR family transcriptional regulator [Kofleriaceae bacterium]
MDRNTKRAEETRKEILDAAEATFAERGFAAASMREIARRAKTSQALIHHHFDTKVKLYEAVKQRFTDRFDVERPTKGAALDPTFIISIVRGYFEFLRAQPNLTRLTAWARLEGDEQAWGASDGIWQRAGEWVRRAKRAGLIRADVDDKLMLVVGAALVQHWIDHRAFLCRALDLDPDDPELDERYLVQALEILVRGVEK